MGTQNRQFFLWAVLLVLGALLYNAWTQEQGRGLDSTVAAAESEQTNIDDVPKTLKNTTLDSKTDVTVVQQPLAIRQKTLIQVKTDVYELAIDKRGGDIVRLNLSQYAQDAQSLDQGFSLLSDSSQRYYLAQSGLASEQGPDIHGVGRALFETKADQFTLQGSEDELIVELNSKTHSGVQITKRFIFKRGSYLIQVQYLIHNHSHAPYFSSFYARLKRKAVEESSGGFLGVQTFTGAAIHTPETPFKKLTFKEMSKKLIERSVRGGWAAFIEHYFVCAWMPPVDVDALYQAQEVGSGIYSVGFVQPSIAVEPGDQKTIESTLYAGPEIVETLASLRPGLDLAVDYGILWPICQPIFWLLKKMFLLTQNWGMAIILTTIAIKALFYKLSASSYRSMGNMKKMQPKMEALKERYADDKAKLSQAMMALYKTEKINPFGGCLPVLVQIPVFIALYYVLLGSVELREAPFMLWIHDLSIKDPFYVLPILMGASMFVQQRLNPAPADPVQAKVMMFMPLVFTFLFFNFPAGLVLYWFVNNVLSILQQWFISRSIESQVKGHGSQ